MNNCVSLLYSDNWHYYGNHDGLLRVRQYLRTKRISYKSLQVHDITPCHTTCHSANKYMPNYFKLHDTRIARGYIIYVNFCNSKFLISFLTKSKPLKNYGAVDYIYKPAGNGFHKK